MKGCLYLVATPIGNLGDMTHRAVEVLRSVDFIVAEDTRTSRRLLRRYAISTPFYSSIYQGAERQRIPAMLSLLDDGKQLALISDAGTPLISDPGFPLVRAAIEAGHTVVPVPGASAALAALIASGLPVDRFVFEGALPRARGARLALLAEISDRVRTTVFYESAHRIVDTLRLLAEILPSRRIVVARELTKVHEEFLRGSAVDLLDALSASERRRGEFVVVVEGSPPSPRSDQETYCRLIAALRAEGVANRSIARILTEALDVPRNDAYRMVHESSEDANEN